MKTKEVHYERKFNLGNYETETIGIVVQLDEGEKFTDVLNQARKAVLSQGISTARPQPAKVQELQMLLEKKSQA